MLPNCFSFRLSKDSADKLRVDGDRTERQVALRLLLPGRSAGHLPGPGPRRRRQEVRLDVRVHARRRRQLRREGDRGVRGTRPEVR